MSNRRLFQLYETRNKLALAHKGYRANPPGSLGSFMKRQRTRIERMVSSIDRRIADAVG